MLSKIGSFLEQILYADEYTPRASRMSFTSILVEVNITRYLRNLVNVQDPKVKVFEQ